MRMGKRRRDTTVISHLFLREYNIDTIVLSFLHHHCVVHSFHTRYCRCFRKHNHDPICSASKYHQCLASHGLSLAPPLHTTFSATPPTHHPYHSKFPTRDRPIRTNQIRIQHDDHTLSFFSDANERTSQKDRAYPPYLLRIMQKDRLVASTVG